MNLVKTVKDWFDKEITKRGYWSQVLRKLRRFYLGTFFPSYVQKSIAETREGECHRCGLCCELVYKCPFLGRDAQNLPYCRVYGDLRPANCLNYPLDIKDSEIDTCGYTFKPKSKVEPPKANPK
jgi:hypothetical protein